MLTQRQHWLNWFLLTMFFFTHYFVRISPSLMSIELMKQFSISISHIGIISSLYFLTYTFSQIPVGYLMKTYSTRTLIGGASFACALTALSFSLSITFPGALISLMMFSFFGSFGFIGAVSYASQNIPAYGSLLVGLTQSLGMAAGFIATNVITAQLNIRSWQEITQYSVAGLAFLGSLIFLLVPCVTSEAIQESPTADVTPLEEEPPVSIYRNMQTWTNALYAGFLYFPLMVFTEGGLGPGLLSSIHQHSREDIAFAISMIFIAWMVGGPVCGFIADHYGRTKLMRLSAISGLITAGSAIFIPMSATHLAICLFLFGITNTGIVGCYSIAAEMHGPKNASVSIAIANMATILIGSILGGILPSVLELTSNPTFVDGIPYYSAYDYQRIFGTAIIITPIIAYICASLTRELKPKKVIT